MLIGTVILSTATLGKTVSLGCQVTTLATLLAFSGSVITVRTLPSIAQPFLLVMTTLILLMRNSFGLVSRCLQFLLLPQQDNIVTAQFTMHLIVALSISGKSVT